MLTREFITTGLLLLIVAGPALAFDDFYFEGNRIDRGYSPFAPGAQNNSNWGNNNGWGNNGRNNNGWYDDGYYDDGWYDDGVGGRNYSPFTPGMQNNNGWNNGWNNNWNYQQQPVRPQVVYSQQPIKISMPADQPGLCAYVLGDGSQSWNYTMSPGKSQTFKEDRGWKVTYDRGNGFGEQSYSLKPGHYRFRQSSRGWELYRSDSSADDNGLAPPPPM